MSSPRLTRGRYSQPGCFYSVTMVVAERRAAFAEGESARIVESELHASETRGDVANIAWVVMPDHVHWLFELRAPSLGAAVQRFKSLAARSLNAAQGREGRLWQPGYYDHGLRDDEDLATQARYILENPVRRGLCSELGRYPHAWCRFDL